MSAHAKIFKMQLLIKRIIDIVGSGIGLVFFTPVFLVGAFAIKATDGGPVFFRQERLGRHGKVFKILKFRTMVVNAEKIGTGLFVKTEKDDRITRVGKLLRATSLDELPQLWNVFKGEMSLVGPRPPVPYYPYTYENYSIFQRRRFSMKPGMTGLAQSTVRNSVPWEMRIPIDIEYLERFTLWLDMKILLSTLLNLLKFKNIYLKNEMQIKKSGENMQVTIRSFRKEDISLKIKWINDPRNSQYLHYDLPLNEEKTLQWYTSLSGRKDRADFTIEVNGKPVGLIGILSIDPKNKKGEYYVAIGEGEFKGKGVAKAASLLLLELAKKELGLQKLYLFTEEENIPAQKLFESLGFKKEGLLLHDILRDGKRINRFVYGIDLNVNTGG